MEQDLGQIVFYAYDGRGRLEKVTNARTDELRYAYHPWGGLESLNRPDFTGGFILCVELLAYEFLFLRRQWPVEVVGPYPMRRHGQ